MNDWSQTGWIPKGGLICWNSAEASATGRIVPDLSGNGRTLDAGPANPPALQANILNGLPAIYFNGSSNEPLKYTGTVNVKHVFIIASYEIASFSNYAGLIGGISTNDILVGFNGLAQWFDYSGVHGAYDYRLADVNYAESAALAPMNGQHRVIEYSNTAGLTMSGLQIGQQKTFTDRRWRGWYFESLIYDRILTEQERRMLYEYFSAKYFLWPKITNGITGPDVFPFQADWPQRKSYDRSVILTTTISGKQFARSKSEPRYIINAQFSDRNAAEITAAATFWATHYPSTQCVYRDESTTPATDRIVHLSGNITFDSSTYHSTSYSLEFIENL